MHRCRQTDAGRGRGAVVSSRHRRRLIAGDRAAGGVERGRSSPGRHRRRCRHGQCRCIAGQGYAGASGRRNLSQRDSAGAGGIRSQAGRVATERGDLHRCRQTDAGGRRGAVVSSRHCRRLIVVEIVPLVALNVAVVAPAATVADAGTVSAAALLDKAMLAPPAGAT